MNGYFDAKVKIFDNLKSNGCAILNNDDDKVAALKGSIKNKIITYGMKSGRAAVRAENWQSNGRRFESRLAQRCCSRCEAVRRHCGVATLARLLNEAAGGESPVSRTPLGCVRTCRMYPRRVRYVRTHRRVGRCCWPARGENRRFARGGGCPIRPRHVRAASVVSHLGWCGVGSTWE